MPLFVVHLVMQYEHHLFEHVWRGDASDTQDAVRHARESGLEHGESGAEHAERFTIKTGYKDLLTGKWIETTTELTEWQGGQLIRTTTSVLELPPHMVDLPTIEKVLAHLARHENVAMRREAARDLLTATPVLTNLAEDEEPSVRMDVAENPATPLRVVMALANDHHTLVHRAAQAALTRRLPRAQW